MLKKINDERNWLINFDGIIFNNDFSIIKYLLKRKDNYTDFHLNVLDTLSDDALLFYLENRNRKDLLEWISNGKYNYDNFDLSFMKEKEFYDNYHISDFGNKLNMLMSAEHIDKLYVLIDKNNIRKLLILDSLFDDLNRKNVVCIDESEKEKYLRSEKINTLFLNDDNEYVKYDFLLKGKSLFINDTGWIYDFFISEEINNVVKVTKNKWEEKPEMNTSFMKIDKYVNKENIMKDLENKIKNMRNQ